MAPAGHVTSAGRHLQPKQSLTYSEVVAGRSTSAASYSTILTKINNTEVNYEWITEQYRYLKSKIFLGDNNDTSGTADNAADLVRLMNKLDVKMDQCNDNIGEIRTDITNLNSNVDNLNMRVQNTEHQLGLKASASVAPQTTSTFQSYKPQVKTFKTSGSNMSPQEASRINNNATQQLKSTPPPKKEEEAPLPMVFYKGGSGHQTLPTPHIEDLVARFKKDSMLSAALQGLNLVHPDNKVGGKKATQEDKEAYEKKQQALLLQLGQTGDQFVRLLEKGRGAEGRLTKWLRQVCRDTMAKEGYTVNPVNRRLHDWVDGNRLNPSYNWHINYAMKKTLEDALKKNDFKDVDGPLRHTAPADLRCLHLCPLRLGRRRSIVLKRYIAHFGK